MTEFKNLTDDQLHFSGINAVRAESAAGIQTMNHIIEANRRHLYSKYNCQSLYDYCVKYWKMTNGDAWRKISAAKLVSESRELELKLNDGSLTQTHLADAAIFFKKENFTREQKIEALKEIENTSTEKAKSILLSKSKAPEKHLKDKIKQKTAKLTEVTLYLDEEAMNDLKRLREIWSNAIPTCELSKIAKRAFKEAIEKNDPVRKDKRRKFKREQKKKSHGGRQNNNASVPGQNSENAACAKPVAPTTPVPGSKAEIRYRVRKRDQYRCTFIDERTNERCEAKHFLEEDHILPRALGGEYTAENLRLRCRTHNQRHAINTYGLKKMRFHMKNDHEACL